MVFCETAILVVSVLQVRVSFSYSICGLLFSFEVPYHLSGFFIWPKKVFKYHNLYSFLYLQSTHYSFLYLQSTHYVSSLPKLYKFSLMRHSRFVEHKPRNYRVLYICRAGEPANFFSAPAPAPAPHFFFKRLRLRLLIFFSSGSGSPALPILNLLS